MNTRDEIVLKKIIQYADEISETISRFNLTQDSFTEDFVARNAISMCILQIGELVGKLSDEFKAENNEYHKSKDNAIDFVNLIEKYIGIKELTYEVLHELIDRVEVGEKYEYQGETYQDINIYYKFVGTVEFNSEQNIEKAG